MTNEEAIKAMTKYMPKDKDSVSLVLREAMNMGIKALEHEPKFILKSDGTIEQIKNYDVLDKIRAEIEEQVLESLSDGGDDWFAAEKVNECLEIIDKYKAESEDKE